MRACGDLSDVLRTVQGLNDDPELDWMSLVQFFRPNLRQRRFLQNLVVKSLIGEIRCDPCRYKEPNQDAEKKS
jgi:hypothetical protein